MEEFNKKLDVLLFIEDCEVSKETVELAKKAWSIIWAFSNFTLDEPAILADEGEIAFHWHKRKQHIQLDIFPNKVSEFFYMNSATEEAWGEEYDIGDPLSKAMKEKLSLFF